jgi:dipeptidyl aminopeptidase/acylaminoacyl peptidase
VRRRYQYRADVGDRTPKPFIASRFGEWGARFSPDGKWIAFISDASGRYEIYVRQYAGAGRQWQVSTDGGEEPVWTPDGRAIVYRNARKLMSARFESAPEVIIHPARMVFEGSFVNAPGFSHDMAPDGRVLLLKADESGPVTQINLILNWFADVRQKMR